MLAFLQRWLNASSAHPALRDPGESARGTDHDVFPEDRDAGDYAITRYPPFDQGIPVISADKILRAQQELVNR